MKKSTIIFIISLMSIAILGIAIIQFYWIKWSVDLQEKSFDDKVITALDRTHRDLVDDVQSKMQSINNLNKYYKKNPGYLKTDIEPFGEQLGLGFESPRWKNKTIFDETLDIQDYLNSNRILDELEPQKVGAFLKRRLEGLGIGLPFDYGVYSNASNNFSIINGHYVVSFDSPNASPGVQNKGLYNTAYNLKLFGKAEAPGELRIFFPGKNQYLWSSAWPSLLSSLLFTGLILFCFIYTIVVILRQKRVSEMKTDFINNMTHEFKTPIATISLAVDSINSPMVLSHTERVQRFANIIKQENKRMLGQVEKVLQMAVLEKEDFELKYTQFDLHEVIQQAVNNMTLKVNKLNGSITYQLDAKPSMMSGDLTHLSNVVYNLLDNAVKYSKEAPHVKIRTYSVPGKINMDVEDSGIGMSKEDVKNIFDKFFRVHTGNLHDVKGFGLGLSYVKVIMDAHKGIVNVKSELGKGSTFTISIPLK